jgi:thioredoxin 1
MSSKIFHEFDEASFARDVLGASVPVVVEFGAEWCGPCRALEPLLHRLAESWGETRKVGSVDIDASPALATRYGVRSAPTVVVFAGGKEVARHVGLTSAEKIRALVDTAVG